MHHRRQPPGTLRAFACALLVAMAATLLAPAPGLADWQKDAKEAAIKYADKKKDEIVKEQAKKAVFSLYSRLYKSGASRGLPRALAEVALSAPELNALANETAEAYGSGDSEKIREASEKVAVKFGEQISRLASNPETRQLLGSIIGSADKVREISGMLGNVAAGTPESRRAAAKYVGETLISVMPGAAVVGFYQTAYGVMKYAHNEFVDSQIEGLYQQYKDGKLSQEALITQLGRAPYDYIVRDRMKDLRDEKAAAVADAAKAAGEKVMEHLTKTTDDEVIKNIIATFDSRAEKERQEGNAVAEREKAQKEAETILNELNWAAKGRHGSDWYEKGPVNLEKFTSIVRDQLKADGVLDPNDPLHVKLMSKAASIAMIHGKNSKEYAKVLEELAQAKKAVLDTNKGAYCLDGSPTQALAGRLWQKGRQLVADGKPAAALPLLKQSVELCPDKERAAQLAELAKLATTSVQDFDGSYAGEIKLTSLDLKSPSTGTLTLIVKNGAVTGTLNSRQKMKERPDLIRKADIVGRVSAEGRITATIKGTSAMEKMSKTAPTTTLLSKEGQKFLADVMFYAIFTYPIEGSLTGQIAEGLGSGKFSANRLGNKPRPNQLSGTWTAHK
jgi:hypothetical protein